MTNFPKQVKIVEVGPRDGLQNEPEVISTDDKVHFVDLLSEAGLPVIEVSSFVHPKGVPQLADASLVYLQIRKKKGVRYPMLVPNEKGLARALDVGVKEIAVFTAASETFNQKNINMTIEASLKEIEAVVKRARTSGARATRTPGQRSTGFWIRGYVSTCFVCPYDGVIAPERVRPIVDRLLELGVDEISIGDTIGAAESDQVEALFSLLLASAPAERLAAHFHDTHGRALKNIERVLNLGITTLDTAAGGLGGCPYAPGAPGNVATEDVLHFLHERGVATGVQLGKVVVASRFLSDVLKRPLWARYPRSQNIGSLELAD